MEVGGLVARGGDALPVRLKFGVAERTEVEFELDAIRSVATEEGVVTSPGDLLLGVRSRLAGASGGPTFAVGAWVKLPSAREQAGTGEFDERVAGIVSLPAGALSIDGNLGLAALGRADGATLGQLEAIVTLNLPARQGLSPYVELAGQHVATEGSGGFFDAGVLYAASRRVVLDAAAGCGWSGGYPDWTVTIGWTILVKEAGHRSRRVAVLDDDREGDR